MNDTGKTILTFLTGAAAGALAGILLAPESGKKTREMISQKALDLKEDLDEAIDTGTDKLKDLSQSVFSDKSKLIG